ncbi:hypothetical protein HK101_007222, partial [Irineochytrium annulatum]
MGELEDLIDLKSEEMARLQIELQKMGENVVEEIEKRAELQVSKDALQEEIEEMTKTLFEEANELVSDEARLRHFHENREKSLEQELAEVRLQLQMEQLQIRELNSKLEEAMAVKEAAERARKKDETEVETASVAASDASTTVGTSTMVPLRPASVAGSVSSTSTITARADPPADPMLLLEFEDFLKNGPMIKLSKLHTLAFMKNTYDDDVVPCLRFGGNPRTSTRRLVDAIALNSCFVEEMSPQQIAAAQEHAGSAAASSNSSPQHRRNTSSSDPLAPSAQP